MFENRTVWGVTVGFVLLLLISIGLTQTLWESNTTSAEADATVLPEPTTAAEMETEEEEVDASVEPINLPADFFVASDTIEGWRQDADIDAMRTHSWDLWLQMSQPSGQDDLPIWETWYSDEDISAIVRGEDTDTTGRDFQVPDQLTHFAVEPLPASELVVEFNKYSPDSANYMIAGNALSNDQPYTETSTLDAIRASDICQDASNPQACTLTFPSTAVNLKPVFYPVSASQMSVIPVWEGVSPNETVDWDFSAFDDAKGNGPGPETWLNCRIIDPTGEHAPGDVVAIEPRPNVTSCTEGIVVAIDDFYHLTVNAEEAMRMQNPENPQPNTKITPISGDPVEVTSGDSVVLMGMHTTTREVEQWVWQSFWWSPAPDDTTLIFPPSHASAQAVYDDGAMYVNWPGSGANRPAELAAPWDNYVMCTNYMFVYPAQPLVGGDQGEFPEFCFNPYLESSFSPEVAPSQPNGNADTVGGINTNCIACHGNAAYPGDDNFGYVAAQYISRDNANFVANGEARLQTDFSWGLLTILGEVEATPETTPEATPETTPPAPETTDEPTDDS